MKEFEQNDSLVKSAETDWSIIRDLHIDEAFQYLVNYLTDAVEHLFLSFIAYLTLCSVFYIRSLYCDHCGNFQRRPKRILVVVAHPDDECMFFGPTILKLTRNKKCQVYLLCLSRGNAAGLGKVRKEELWNACSKLGILSENIVLINSTQLQDSPATEWREDVIAKTILSRIEELQIDTLITFDKQGVSKHKNHCSIFYAVAFLCLDNRVPDYCTVYTLESVNLLRKYWLLLDVPISYLLSSHRFILNWSERKRIVSAMNEHKSQMVWFRKLFMIFSRYTMINTLHQMNKIDLEFDLEVDPD